MLEKESELIDDIIMLRKEKGLSQTELGNLAGISRSHVSLIERKLKSPTLHVLCAIAEALDMTIEMKAK